MSTITTRSGKGSPLTNSEVDTNFTNLNTDKLENIAGESIKNLSDVNSSMSPSAGDALVYDASNGWQSGTVSTGAVANTVVVTVANSKFVIDGTSQQALTLSPSVTYRFDQSNNSNANHPLKFSTTDNGTHNSGSEFTTGVTVSGTAGSTDAYVEIKLEQDAPSTLYYYCGNHSGMGGVVSSGGTAVTVQDEGSSLSTAAETLNFTGAGVTASGTGAAKTINIPGATVSTNGSLDPVKQTEFTATANQTSFSVAYGVGNISVYLNGSKLAAADYTATNGTSVALAAGATAGDLVVVEEYGIPFASPYTASVYTASAGQTTLSVSYTVAKVAVFVNGVKLLIGANADVVAANGTSLTFNTALSAGDKIEVVEHGALVESTTTFTGLTDTPSSLGSAGQVAQVNSAGNAIEFADAGSGTTTVANITELEALTASEGDMAFVTGTNGLFIKKTVGWYKIADVVNNQLNSVTVTMTGGVEKTSGWQLPVDGVTNTTATGAATDPEGLSVTWSAAPISPATLSGTNIVVSGTNVASLTQGTGANSHVFTIAPVATAGEFNFSIRFSVTDGVNAALSTDKAYILNFATLITDSKYTTMLAQAVGSNNGTNTPITDSSSAGRTVTTFGTPGTDRITQGAFTPYRRYSRKTLGNTYSIEADFPTGVNLGSGSFTMEFWFKLDEAFTSGQARNFVYNNYNNVELQYATSYGGSNFRFTGAINNKEFTTPAIATLDVGTWYHFCVTKSNVSPYPITFYLNGSQIHTVNGNNTNDTQTSLQFFSDNNLSPRLVKMHDFRVVKNSLIVPSSGGPDEPLGEVSGTFMTAFTTGMYAFKIQTSSSDATLKTKNFAQYGSNNVFAISRDLPYDSLEYNVDKHGGAIDFREQPSECYSIDLSGDTSLDLTGDYTIEFWVYDDSYSTNWRSILTIGNDEIYLMSGSNTTTGRIYTSFGPNKSGCWMEKTWNHVAIVRSGMGTDNTTLYINGQELYDNTKTNSFSSGNAFRIGANSGGSSERFRDIVSDIRITNGTALYTSDFEPPTEPLPSTNYQSTNATLHIKGTDASVVDKSGNASLSLIADTKCVSTAVVHNSSTISSKSMYFDGTSDHVILPNDLLALPDTKTEFSMEMWAKFDDFSGDNGYRTLIYNGNESGSTRNFWFGALTTYGNYRLGWQSGGGNAFDATTNISANTWYHIAMVKQKDQSNPTGGNPTVKLFINGAEYATNTSARGNYAIPSSSTYLGKETSVQGPMKGYIQDFRFRKGYVGWVLNGSTYTYPVPTAELKG